MRAGLVDREGLARLVLVMGVALLQVKRETPHNKAQMHKGVCVCVCVQIRCK